MVLLQKDIKSHAFLTLSENESFNFSISSSEYNLKLKNSLTRNEYTDIAIFDESLNKPRYNFFQIKVVDDPTKTELWEYNGEEQTTYIYNLLTGWYEYFVYDLEDNELEKGKLLIKLESEDIIEYETEQNNTIVYEG